MSDKLTKNTNMTVVPFQNQTTTKQIQVFDEKKQERLIKALRTRLMRSAVRFVIDGATDEWKNKIQSRARIASDLSGIPVVLIEAEVKKLLK